MDMANDGKVIRLDTPQAVKEALASGKDLYNPETGEFWWEYNYTGSIANTYVHLDDPNLLAVIDNPDFDLYEDIVGGLNYTGYITDSIETIIEDGEENAPLIDPRDEETGHWGHGTYYDSLASAAADLEGRAISAPGMEVICPDFWYRDDIESALEEAGLEVNDENVDAALEALDLDGEPILSNFHDRLAETGNEMIADAVNNIEPNGGGGGGAPEAFVDRGISLKAMAESMRRASQALSANGGTDAPDGKDECQPSFTPDLS